MEAWIRDDEDDVAGGRDDEKDKRAGMLKSVLYL